MILLLRGRARTESSLGKSQERSRKQEKGGWGKWILTALALHRDRKVQDLMHRDKDRNPVSLQ